VIAIIAFVVALVAYAVLAYNLSLRPILTITPDNAEGGGGGGLFQIVLPNPLGLVVSSGVTAVSTLSGIVGIVRFAMDVLHARRRRTAQPVAADTARIAT
jgi:hypothetical protein